MNKMYPCPYYMNNKMYPCQFCIKALNQEYDLDNQYNPYYYDTEDDSFTKIKDYGPKPFVVNIEEVTKENNTFRTALWTGEHLQLTLMSIKVGEDIGLEIHPHLDQFIRIEEGQGLVKMGVRKDKLDFQQKVYDDYAFIIPAGTWHNLVNTGTKPLKLYSIYAPPQHPKGTVHKTKADAEENHADTVAPVNPLIPPSKTSFTTKEAMAIAKTLGIDFNKVKFDIEQFRMGLDTELEHGRKYYPTNVTGDDPITTGKIALAHLTEFPDYYTRLKKLEEEAKAYWATQL